MNKSLKQAALVLGGVAGAVLTADIASAATGQAGTMPSPITVKMIQPGQTPKLMGEVSKEMGPSWSALEGGMYRVSTTTTTADGIVRAAPGGVPGEWDPILLRGPITGTSAGNFRTSLGINVSRIEFEPLQISPVKLQTGEYRPGAPRIGLVKFTLLRSRASADQTAWLQAYLAGNASPRDISVDILDASLQQTLRTYGLKACYPVGYTVLPQVRAGGESLVRDTVIVKCQRIDVGGPFRPDFIGWVQGAVQGNGALRDLSISIGQGEPFAVNGAWLTEFVFPLLDAADRAVPSEEFRFQPKSVVRATTPATLVAPAAPMPLLKR